MTTQFGPLSVGEDGAALFDERGKRLADLYLVPHFREPSDLVDLQGRRLALALAQMFADAPRTRELVEELAEALEIILRIARTPPQSVADQTVEEIASAALKKAKVQP